jgi:hypothetical protein
MTRIIGWFSFTAVGAAGVVSIEKADFFLSSGRGNGKVSFGRLFPFLPFFNEHDWNAVPDWIFQAGIIANQPGIMD